ncbi:hypothetical protein GCM10027445_31020 [Amycolatopsis endophytica]|uniref:DUF3137 domain-containing protein n=1 Tax=Amycolatopsis endophytica TaxID=860233 RepID=A0A853B106_9PSEU|nr:hypothetical protein [Amycolatopsis endophytica]NYI88728.1 hypothetical protein [Amycolatopsis endophytica]
MVIVLILIGIIACGVVAGLVLRPRVRAAEDAFAQRVRALSDRTGWQPDRAPLPPLQEAFPGINDVLGSTFHHGIQVNLQLAGPWRGVPVRVLQLRYRTEHVATVRAATMVLVPRPVPGPSLLVHGRNDHDALRQLPPGIAQQIVADPRTQPLFFTPEHLAAVFPGEITQDLTVAAADLLTELRLRLDVR